MKLAGSIVAIGFLLTAISASAMTVADFLSPHALKAKGALALFQQGEVRAPGELSRASRRSAKDH